MSLESIYDILCREYTYILHERPLNCVEEESRHKLLHGAIIWSRDQTRPCLGQGSAFNVGRASGLHASTLKYQSIILDCELIMRRAQSTRHYPRPSLALGADDLGVLRENPDETIEDALRRQLLEKDRENDKVEYLLCDRYVETTDIDI